MRAVWSFWSKPFREYKGRMWYSPLHHLLAWGLSLRLAQRHYPETMLVTDHAGKARLVDHLGLSFTHVSTELDRIQMTDVGWWGPGKLVAYRLQDQPFVHLDSDVFLWKPLTRHITEAPVFAQCPENFHSVDESYSPRDIEDAFARHNLRLPSEWEWSRSRGDHWFREENYGIIGGKRFDFLQHYSQMALNLMLGLKMHPRGQSSRTKNASIWWSSSFCLPRVLISIVSTLHLPMAA